MRKPNKKASDARYRAKNREKCLERYRLWKKHGAVKPYSLIYIPYRWMKVV